MVTIACGDIIFNDIEAIVFDKDGTLANVETFLWQLGQRRTRLLDAQIPGVQAPLLMAFGIDNSEINPAGMMAVASRYENEIAAAAYIAETGRSWFEALQIVRHAFAEVDREFTSKAKYTPPIEGAIDCIQALSSQGIRLGILSSDTDRNIEEFLTYYNIRQNIQAIVGAAAGISKPNPILLKNICEQIGVPPAKVLVVGDAQVDIELAQQGGAAGAIGVYGGWKQPSELRGATVLVKNLSEINSK